MKASFRHKTNWIGIAVIIFVVASFLAGVGLISQQRDEVETLKKQRDQLTAERARLEDEKRRLEIDIRQKQGRLNELARQVSETDAVFGQVQRAETNYINKNWGPAAQQFCEALRKLPDFTYVAVRCGWSLYRAGAEENSAELSAKLIDQSIEVLKDARSKNPTNEQATYSLAIVFAWQGEDAEAFKLLKQLNDEQLKQRALKAKQFTRLRKNYDDSKSWFESVRQATTANAL